LATIPLSPVQAQEPEAPKAIAGAGHTIILCIVVAAWAIRSYMGMHKMAADAHPHRVILYVTTTIWEWAVVGYIVWGVKRHGSTVRELIGGRWNGAEDFFKDVGIAAGFWFVSLFVLGGTALALHANRRGDELGSMLPQTGLESLLWVMTAVTAGICEEIIFRGYFQKQLVAWTNNVSAGVLLTAIIFGSVHLYQGWKSAVVILVFGLLFGMLAEWRKSLRPGMMAHAWQDTIAGLLAPMLLRALKNVPK
jgi:membrane protease YdiL (CAAX protease family)